MVAVTICSDFGAQENTVSHCFHCFPIYLLWSDGTSDPSSDGCHDLRFLNVEFKPAFLLSSFTFLKRLFSSFAFCHKGGVICISEIIDIFPSNLDSGLCFIQPAFCTFALISHTSKHIFKILQSRLQQDMNWELPDVQARFRKGRGTRDQIADIHWIIEKAREFQKKHLLLLHWLC